MVMVQVAMDGFGGGGHQSDDAHDMVQLTSFQAESNQPGCQQSHPAAAPPSNTTLTIPLEIARN